MVTIGETVSHYRILEKLGGGGMGVVYRAHDEHLDRDVALKVLPAGLLADETARSRFRREALTLSRLNHPNIAVVYDFDSANDADFLTMEFVEGETLAAKTAAGPLPEKDVIALGTQIAEALEDAHEHKVIHRDLKPANVMVTAKGRAKVLDFGLAKLVKPAGAEADAATASLAESQPGVVMGTVPYMAPEQLQGKAADSRADLYGLGTILYEMATGQRPFPEKQSTPLVAAILTQCPQPPRELNGQVSPSLEAIILKALAKSPDERYQSAKELLEDLGRVASSRLAGPAQPDAALKGGATGPAAAGAGFARPRVRSLDSDGVHRTPGIGEGRALPYIAIAAALVALVAVLVAFNVAGLRERAMTFVGASVSRRTVPLPRIQSLAVLPLANLSGDPQQEYFADGMTEELITNLAKISALKVISRSSVMQYKGTRKPAAEIAKELDVDALIEGSVLREGGQVRITAKLIEASTDKNLWAESYQREIRSVLALQGEIAGAIAGKVRAALTPAERSHLTSARPVNPEAYEAYLKGMQHWYKLTPRDVDTALQYFELALKKDPNYAPAYAGVAMVWIGRQQMGYTAPREAGPKAKAAALKAIELDNTLAQAHSSLADSNCYYEWDWAAAESEFKRAIKLNPSYAHARAGYSFYLMMMKRREEAMAQIQRALELDPFNAFFQAFHAVNLECAGRYDEAIVESRKALRTSPGLPFAHWMLSGTFFQKGLYEESLAEVKAYYAGDREIEEALTQGYVQSGYQGAMKRVADIWAARAPKTYTLPSDVAMLYVWAGEKAQALEWLEKGFEVRDPNMPVANVDPTYNTLRSDPRFQALLRRMNFPQ